MNKVSTMNKKMEIKINESYKKNYLQIPFEIFVLYPDKYLSKLENFLNIKFDNKVFKTMKKEKVPRSKIINGRDAKIYRKYGWVKGNNKYSENDEISNKFDFIANQNIKSKYLEFLKKCQKIMSQNFCKKF